LNTDPYPTDLQKKAHLNFRWAFLVFGGAGGT
jgi:hypothetical protein